MLALPHCPRGSALTCPAGRSALLTVQGVEVGVPSLGHFILFFLILLFIFNVGVDLVCKGLGKASGSLPCSLSLLNQNNASAVS